VAIASATVKGGTVKIVQIQLSLMANMPHRLDMSLVGGGTAISLNRRARVRSAFSASDFPFPTGFTGVVVVGGDDGDNDAPTLDLAIAIAIGLLTLQGVVPPDAVSDVLAIGELVMDGRVRYCRGIVVLAAEAAGLVLRLILLVPASAIEEARIVDRTDSVGIARLTEVEAILCGAPFHPSSTNGADLADIKGLHLATRALTSAAAGGHHLLLVRQPGAGRTMLARRLPDLAQLRPVCAPDEIELAEGDQRTCLAVFAWRAASRILPTRKEWR
jgi:magnesium chelatase family protein